MKSITLFFTNQCFSDENIHEIPLSNKVRMTFLFFASALSSFILQAHAESETEKSNSKLWFEENKNQWPEQVLYRTEIKEGQVFLEKGTFTYLFTDCGDMDGYKHGRIKELVVRNHAYKVHFRNSNPYTKTTASTLAPFVRNYYIGNDSSQWASEVKVYQEVSYSQIYSNIDLKVYSSESGLKYDFVLKPGANLDNIKLDYEGVDNLSIHNGHLNIQTNLGMVIEQKPYSYQIVEGRKTEVPCAYILSGNTLGFFAGSFDKSLPLIIDPQLIFSTYSGSSADNFGFTATYDGNGNGYIGGNVFALGGSYPATVGAFQTTFQGGGFDASLSKYNSTGTALLFATYYGGNGEDQPHSLIVDKNGQLVVFGRTNSTNFPTKAGCYDNSANGGYDIFLGKFNTATGALVASTYLGGSGDDGVNDNPIAWSYTGPLKFNYADDGRGEVMTDNANNIYVNTSTQSANFPTTLGVVDNTLGGKQDACVFKFNSALASLMWSTYLGGSNDDAGYGIKIDATGNPCVTGGTASTNFPTTAGVLKPVAPGGTADGFVTVLNPAATGILRSTYIGTNAYDQSYFIELDNAGDIYVMGQTTGAYPNSAGVYNNPNSGQFIHKMNNTLTTTDFSLTFGTGVPLPNISPTAFLVDSCQNIYASGWGRCTAFGAMPNPNTVTGMPKTANAFQPTTDGCDFYFFVLTSDAKSLWYATFFGENGDEDHVDGGTSRFDRRGVIYQSVCSSCNGYDKFPVGPGVVWSNTNPSPRCSNALIKFDAKVQPVAIASASPSAIGCVPLLVNFSSAGSVGIGFAWNFGDGNTSTTTSPSNTYTAAGTYTVSLIVVDSLSYCAFYDTSYIIITVGAPLVLTTNQTNLICFGANNGSATVSASSTGLTPYTYLWSNGQTTTIASGLIAETYTVVVKDSIGCTSSIPVTITQPPQLTSAISSIPANCGGLDGTATSNPSGGTPAYTYSWNNGQTTQTATGLAQGSYTITITDFAGCAFTAIVPIGGTNNLSANISSVNATCGYPNGSATVTSNGGTAPFTYSWNNGQTTPIATGLAAATYTVIITDANGCADTLSQTIISGGLPTAAVFPTSPCLGTTTSLNDGSIAVAGDPITSWNWTMTGGNPSSSSSQNTSTLYGAAGSYTVTLIVTSAAGCADTLEQPIIIYNNPVAAFSDTASGCIPVCNAFTDLSNAVDGTISSWAWSFPGGIPSSSNQQVPGNVCYNTPGTYSVALTVTNSSGCKNTLIINPMINAYPLPKADFCVTPAQASAADPVFTFCDMWTPNPGVTQWYWDFGDGSPFDSIKTDPVHSYSATAVFNDFYVYNVCLYVKNQYGCRDTLCKTVEILPEFSFYIPNSFTPNADNTNELFFGKGRGIKEYDIWLFDRWGNLIWDCHSNGDATWDINPSEGTPSDCKWDGKVQKGGADLSGDSNRLLQEDVYVWKVKLKDIFDKKHTYVGHVNVVK